MSASETQTPPKTQAARPAPRRKRRGPYGLSALAAAQADAERIIDARTKRHRPTKPPTS